MPLAKKRRRVVIATNNRPEVKYGCGFTLITVPDTSGRICRRR